MNWTICLSNEGYVASLEPRKLYKLVTDEKAEQYGMVRIVDESGEDYLYPKAMFAPMVVPKSIESQLLAA